MASGASPASVKVECRCNGAAGVLRRRGPDGFSWTPEGAASGDGKDAAVHISLEAIHQLQTSVKKPCAARVVMRSNEVGGGGGESNQATMPTKLLPPLVLEFTDPAERQVFVEAVTMCQRVKKEEADSKKDVKGHHGGAAVAVPPQSFSFHANVSQQQRQQEGRQLRALLVSSLALTQQEQAAMESASSVLLETKAAAVSAVDSSRQPRGVVSVFDALASLLNPATGTLQPITEQRMSDIFSQVPELAIVFANRVKSKSQEVEFWEAVVRKTLFFTNTFLEHEIARVRAAMRKKHRRGGGAAEERTGVGEGKGNGEGGGGRAACGGEAFSHHDPTLFLEQRDNDAAPPTAGSAPTSVGSGRPRQDHQAEAEALMSQWNSRSMAVVAQQQQLPAAGDAEAVATPHQSELQPQPPSPAAGRGALASEARRAAVRAHTELFSDLGGGSSSAQAATPQGNTNLYGSSAAHRLWRRFVPTTPPPPPPPPPPCATGSVVYRAGEWDGHWDVSTHRVPLLRRNAPLNAPRKIVWARRAEPVDAGGCDGQEAGADLQPAKGSGADSGLTQAVDLEQRSAALVRSYWIERCDAESGVRGGGGVGRERVARIAGTIKDLLETNAERAGSIPVSVKRMMLRVVEVEALTQHLQFSEESTQLPSKRKRK